MTDPIYNQPEPPFAATLTDYRPPADESPRLIADGIKEQVVTLETQVNTLRDTITRERANVRSLYENLNDAISDNELNEEDTITYGELSEILSSVFGNGLSFLKNYQAFVELRVKVTVDYKAASSSDADEIANSIGLDIRDDAVTYDGEAEVSEIWVDNTSVLSVEEQ